MRNGRVWIAISFLLFVLCCQYGEGKLTIGDVDTPDDFFYLGKFTYSNNGVGSLVVTTSNVQPAADANVGEISIAVYNNDPSADWYWPSIWNNDSLSCSEKYDSQYTVFKGPGAVINNTELVFELKNDNIWTWYFVMIDCNLSSDENLSMYISLEWKNPGNGWYEQFSVEDQDLLTIYLVFFLVWLILFPVFLFFLFKFFLSSAMEFDTNLKIFITVLVASFISLFMYLVHYSVYAFDGVGVPGILVASDVIMSLASMLYFVVLIQVVSLKSHLLEQPTYLWAVICTLLLVYLGFFFWQEIEPGLDPQTLSYRWETFPGGVMMALQLIFWIIFIIVGLLSFRTAESKRKFLIVFLAIFTVWFWILPLTAAIAAALPEYDRWKAVLSVTLSFNLFSYVAFAFFVFPSQVNNILGTPQFAKSLYNERIIKNQFFDDSESSPYGSL